MTNNIPATAITEPLVEWQSHEQIIKLALVVAAAYVMYAVACHVADRFRDR